MNVFVLISLSLIGSFAISSAGNAYSIGCAVACQSKPVQPPLQNINAAFWFRSWGDRAGRLVCASVRYPPEQVDEEPYQDVWRQGRRLCVSRFAWLQVVNLSLKSPSPVLGFPGPANTGCITAGSSQSLFCQHFHLVRSSWAVIWSMGKTRTAEASSNWRSGR